LSWLFEAFHYLKAKQNSHAVTFKVRPVTWPMVFVTGLGSLAFAAVLATPALSRPAFLRSLPLLAAFAASTGAVFGGACTGFPEETELMDAIYTSDTFQYESPATT
jgi:hypothetical protein